MTNFDFLYGEEKFAAVAASAAAAEKIYGIDAAACVIGVRRAAELAVKWMYANDSALPNLRRDQFAALSGASEFRALVGHTLTRALDFIRRVGNNAAHNPDSVTREQAELSLRNLYDFAVFLAGRYTTLPTPGEYDRSLLDPEAELVTEAFDQADIRRLVAENRALKRQLNALRHTPDAEKEETLHAPSLSEADTRRLYIETALAHAGWKRGINCFAEFRVDGLPGQSGVGYADYVLCGENGVPLALVETQAAALDIGVGRQQATLYADALQRRFGVRPVIFLSNGFSTRIWFDGDEPERDCGGIYSPADLVRARAIRAKRRLPNAADFAALPPLRPYQAEAVRAVADALCQKRQRSALLAMAPGTGKTRTALAAARLLNRCGYIRRLLFLSENDVLTRQSLREFSAAFPDWQAALLAEPRAAAASDALFATFDALLAEADELTDADGAALLTAGRFDLVICDEADRALLQRYGDVLAAFDAPILALTSAPSGELPADLCDLLHLVSPHASFQYSYADAVRDGWLSAFCAADVQLETLAHGVRRDALSHAEKQAFDRIFTARGEEIPAEIPPTAWFHEYYNADTVRCALMYLRTHGRSTNGVLGKTVIFTADRRQSEQIYEEWGRLFPADPPHFCRVIDTTVNYAHVLLEDFSQSDKMPRVALSHDLLTDGVDIPAVENLVFFMQAPSRTVFWRMLGRGMRRCDALPDGKPSFFVLDLYGNFRTFESGDAADDGDPLPVWGRVFALQAHLAAQLQSSAEDLGALRQTLTHTLHKKLSELDSESFSVRRHLSLIERFSGKASFEMLTPADVAALCDTAAPLILPDGTPEKTALFDETMYQLMLARLRGKSPPPAAEKDALRTVQALCRMGSHRKIAAQKSWITRVLSANFFTVAPCAEIEAARRALSPLIRYLTEEDAPPQRTHFTERIFAETSFSVSQHTQE